MRLRSMAALGLFAASMAAHADTLRTYSFLTGGLLTIDEENGSIFAETDSTTGFTPGTFDFRLGGPQQEGRMGLALIGFAEEYFGESSEENPYYQYNVDPRCAAYDEVYGCIDPYGIVDWGMNDVDLGGAVNHSFDTDLTLHYVSTTVTPEPSSFALLGTGLLGVAGVMKRRFA